MDGKVFVYELEVLERHLDTFGHVNNARYLEILEEARWDLITKNGYGLDEIIATGLGPIILEVKLKFKRELRLREKIRIETRTLGYRKKIAYLAQRILNAKDEVAAEAEFTFGLFDTVQRKLVPPTEKWLKGIGLTLADTKG